jgi:hypothetical protein
MEPSNNNPNKLKTMKSNKEHNKQLFTQFGQIKTYVWGRGQLSNPLSNLFLITKEILQQRLQENRVFLFLPFSQSLPVTKRFNDKCYKMKEKT